jgi:glutamate 5-kinase
MKNSRRPTRINERQNERIWVIKAGSQMVVEGGPLLIRDWMRQVASLQKDGIRVVWVTSGAIASARERLPQFSSAQFSSVQSSTPGDAARTSSASPSKTRDLPTQQALSALGQIFVIEQYKLALENLGLQAAQVLLTAEDIAHRSRRQNLTNTLRRLIDWRAIPILNENDAVSTAEIQFGDNDRLSALVARAIGAERLIILTDIDGLYDQDPRQNPNAKLLTDIARVQARHIQSASNAPGSSRGKGGMLSKLIAAQLAGRDGIPVHLVKGDLAKVLLRIQVSVTEADESHPGTRILNSRPTTLRRAERKKSTGKRQRGALKSNALRTPLRRRKRTP